MAVRRLIIAITFLFEILFLVFPGTELNRQAYAASGETVSKDVLKQENPFVLPTVTVTADKRPEEVQKTPIAITVLTAQDLEDAGVKTIRDVLNMTPNLMSFRTMGEATLMSFRGAITSQGTKASPLVMYVDGVPVDTYFNLDANLMDIERIEILRGAQGTMYGKNALGGVINIISKKPANEYEGKIFSFVESLGSYGAGSTVKGPLIEDKLYFSFSAQHDYRAGWMKNDDNDKNSERTERFKGLLRYTPTEQAEINLHFDYTAGRDGFWPAKYGSAPSMDTTISGDDYQHDDSFNAALHAKYDFNSVVLESTTTFSKEQIEWAHNMHELYPSPLNQSYGRGERKSKREEVTQELRLRSPDGESGGIEWLVGLYGSYSEMDVTKFSNKVNMPGFKYYSNNPSTERTTDLAPFGQMALPLTDRLKLTLGLRAQYTQRDFKMTINDNLFYPLESPSVKQDDSWSEVLPKVLLSCQITDNHMIYAGVSRSFIPGGYNWASLDSRSLKYDKQTAWNYEAGAKTSWFDNQLIANLAVFYNEMEDMQVMHWEGPNMFDYVALNAPKAHSYGAELDITALLAAGLTADLSFGVIRAVYDDFEKTTKDSSGNETKLDLSGKHIQHTPSFTGNFGLTYRAENGFFARGQANYFGKIYWDDENNSSSSDVITADARIGYESESFDVYAYGRNIFGKRYHTNYISLNNVSVVAEPQVFGLEFIYKF